jgi:hypothetical protein
VATALGTDSLTAAHTAVGDQPDMPPLKKSKRFDAIWRTYVLPALLFQPPPTVP